MRLNREVIVATLAFIIFLSGLYFFLRSHIGEQRIFRKISLELNDALQEVVPIEPRVVPDDSVGGRNPFHFSTEWQAVTPEVLQPPPILPERRAKVFFGWLNDWPGASRIVYQDSAPVAIEKKKGAQGGDNPPKSQRKRGGR